MNTANHPPDEAAPAKDANGTAARATQNGPPIPPDAQEATSQSEFPFDAPPGTAGVSPTNELAAAVAVQTTPPKVASPDSISEAEPLPTDRRGVQFASSATRD